MDILQGKALQEKFINVFIFLFYNYKIVFKSESFRFQWYCTYKEFTFDSWALGAGLIPIKTPNVFNQIMKVRFVNTIENKLPESNKPILNYHISLLHTKRYKVLFKNGCNSMLPVPHN